MKRGFSGLYNKNITNDSANATTLHKGHHNLTRKILLQRHLPSNCLSSCELASPLLLIFVAKDISFKTIINNYIILLIFFPFKIFVLFLPEYKHGLLNLLPCSFREFFSIFYLGWQINFTCFIYSWGNKTQRMYVTCTKSHCR